LRDRYSAAWEKKTSSSSAHDGSTEDCNAGGAAEHSSGSPALPDWVSKKKRVPVIYYATRTHSQIAQVYNDLCRQSLHAPPAERLTPRTLVQVVRELKRSGYRPKMAILVAPLLPQCVAVPVLAPLLTCVMMLYGAAGLARALLRPQAGVQGAQPRRGVREAAARPAGAPCRTCIRPCQTYVGT